MKALESFKLVHGAQVCSSPGNVVIRFLNLMLCLLLID